VSAFLSGLTQFFAPTHLLAVVALGLLAGQGAPRFPLALCAAYAFGLAVGSVMIAAALRGQNTAFMLLAIAALCGIVIAAAWPIPHRVKPIAACAIGGVLAFNAPPQAITIPSAVAEQIGTGVVALATFVAIVLVAARANRPWQRIGLRVVGSWIAASAILALALRLVR
jgi:urease accessory protein